MAMTRGADLRARSGPDWSGEFPGKSRRIARDGSRIIININYNDVK